MYKNNSRGSSKFKGCSPLQLSCKLTGKCHAVSYYSYTIRYNLFMKNILFIIIFCFIDFPTIWGQELGYIKDIDGFSNIRNDQSSESEIIGIITEGQEFTYYVDNDSEWWKIKYKYLNGYVHKSRIESYDEVKTQIIQFYKEFHNQKNLDAKKQNEFIEKLFLLTKKYPSASLSAFCEQSKGIKDFLLEKYELPNINMVDLPIIYTRLLKLNSSCKEIDLVLKAISNGGDKIGDDLTKLNPNKIKILEWNNPSENPYTSNRLFTPKIDDIPITYFLDHPKIDEYSKLFYQGQFAVSDDTITFSFLDSLLTTNYPIQNFYLLVFNSVLEISDGALGEIMGDYCRSYLERSPCNFIGLKTNKLYSKNYQKWISSAAYEYYFDDEPIKSVNKQIDMIKPKVKANCENQINELENVRSQLIDFIKANE